MEWCLLDIVQVLCHNHICCEFMNETGALFHSTTPHVLQPETGFLTHCCWFVIYMYIYSWPLINACRLTEQIYQLSLVPSLASIYSFWILLTLDMFAVYCISVGLNRKWLSPRILVNKARDMTTLKPTETRRGRNRDLEKKSFLEKIALTQALIFRNPQVGMGK